MALMQRSHGRHKAHALAGMARLFAYSSNFCGGSENEHGGKQLAIGLWLLAFGLWLMAVSHFVSGNSHSLSTGILKRAKASTSSSFKSNTQNNIKAAHKANTAKTKAKCQLLFASLLSIRLHFLASYNRFQFHLGVFRQVVRFCVGRIHARLDVGLELVHGIGKERRGVAISTHKLCRLMEREVHKVMEDQHLSVAVGAGANANRRSADLAGNHGGNFARHAFQHNGKY